MAKARLLIVLFIFVIPADFTIAQKIKIPEFMGMYLVHNGETLELRENEIGLEFPKAQCPDVEFITGLKKLSGIDISDNDCSLIVYMDSISLDSLKLTKLRFVKDLPLDCISLIMLSSKKVNTRINMWINDEDLPYRVAPVENKKGMYRIAPREPLEPGVYALHTGSFVKRNSSSISLMYNFESIKETMVYDFSIDFEQYKDNSPQIVSIYVRQENADIGHPSSAFSASDVFRDQEDGLKHIRDGNYSLSEESFKRALAVNYPADYEWTLAESHFGLGLAFAYQHKFDDAIREFKTSIRAQYKFADPYYSLAGVYSLLGSEKEAIEYFELALGKGFKNYEFIKNDSDLENIRDNPKYKELMHGK